MLSQLDPSKRIEVLTSNSSQIPILSDSFDVVTFKGVLHEIENVFQTLRDASRLCHANGRVIIIDFRSFPKTWLIKSNLRWRIRHPRKLFSPSLDKYPGFTREDILAHIETAGLRIQRYEEDFAPGRFSGHEVRMFLAVAKRASQYNSYLESGED